jgi:hypothetical protein
VNALARRMLKHMSAPKRILILEDTLYLDQPELTHLPKWGPDRKTEPW